MLKTNALLGVEDALLLEDFSKDGDSRVDGVGDDQDEGLGGGLRDGLGKSGADTSVDLVEPEVQPHISCGYTVALTLNKSSRLQYMKDGCQ
jgi:hypothetical protein